MKNVSTGAYKTMVSTTPINA